MSNYTNEAQALAAHLQASGRFVSKTQSGHNLFLATAEHMGMAGKGILVALEGGGCFLWDGERQINAFRLISSGFDMDTAATLADVLNLINEAAP